MNNFVLFKQKLQRYFNEMLNDVTRLFEVDVDKDELWEKYLSSFPAGTNDIYRERREHDCHVCRQFIKNIGAAVSIKDGEVHTIWDVDLGGDKTYQPVCDALSAFVKSHKVKDIYVSNQKKIGVDCNRENKEGEVITWDHLFVKLPRRLVDRSRRSAGDIKGQFRDTKNVFKRSLDEITMEAIDTILELIASNTLYRGKEWESALKEFKNYKESYDKIDSEDEKDLFAWEKSLAAGVSIGRIRNHSIGVLLVDVSDGVELDTAVKRYEQIVAPANYKRPKAIFTKKMLEDAKKKITEMGYLDSLPRRFANLDDITINNVLFSNKDAAKRISGDMDIFGELEKEVAINPKRFSRVEEISAQDFVDNVLPTAREIEALVENKHAQNFVSLIAPVNPDAKTMFKWSNGLSWAYTGNIADSDIKKNVKAAGGKVDGVLRFSIQWNENGRDDCDLDAHCIEPNGNEICFSNCRKPRSSSLGGQLDVDIIDPCGEVAVENITWGDLSKMKPGVYTFFVHQYSDRAMNGFRAEIEFDGEIHKFNYDKSMHTGQKVQVAEVTLNENGSFLIKNKLDGEASISSTEIWGVKTNQFTPVSVISYSPNYFDEQEGIGNKHMFFFLDGCINNEEPNGFYNEFLKNELLEHKRVFEALGSKCRAGDVSDQLSGVGFSLTKRNELIVKVKGATERIMKIKF